MKKIFLFVFLLYFSANSYCQLTSPILIEPPTNCTMVSLTPLLVWSAVNGAVDYEVQISTLPDCSILINAAVPIVPVTQYQVPEGVLLPNTLYYWRVLAHGLNNEFSISAISKGVLPKSEGSG